jgi:hypothetical protein
MVKLITMLLMLFVTRFAFSESPAAVFSEESLKIHPLSSGVILFQKQADVEAGLIQEIIFGWLLLPVAIGFELGTVITFGVALYHTWQYLYYQNNSLTTKDTYYPGLLWGITGLLQIYPVIHSIIEFTVLRDYPKYFFTASLMILGLMSTIAIPQFAFLTAQYQATPPAAAGLAASIAVLALSIPAVILYFFMRAFQSVTLNKQEFKQVSLLMDPGRTGFIIRF